MTPNIQIFSFSRPSTSESDSLLIALFLAAIVHAFVFLGISFTPPQPQKINKQIEITLANSPVKRAPKKASFLAPENQLGAGKETNHHKPPKQKNPSRGKSLNKHPALQQTKAQSRPRTKQKLLTQPKARQKIITAKKQNPAAKKKRPKISMDTLQYQISELGEKIRRSQQSSEKLKFKSVDDVSTHKQIAAQYKLDWETKIQRIAKNVVGDSAPLGTLIMAVGIRADGSIYRVDISKSSGNKVLDDLAKQIAYLASPYPPLPKKLLKEINVLIINKRWNFKNGSLSTKN